MTNLIKQNLNRIVGDEKILDTVFEYILSADSLGVISIDMGKFSEFLRRFEKLRITDGKHPDAWPSLEIGVY